MTNALQRLTHQLAWIEAIPLSPDVGPDVQASVKLDGKDITEAHTYQEWVDKVEDVFDEFQQGLAGQQPSADDARRLLQLQRQEISLLYRTNCEKPVTRNFEVLRLAFTTVIGRYKLNPDLYPGGDGQLTALDREQIQHACLHYPVAVERLLARNVGGVSNDPWTMGFVKFCLRSPGASGMSATPWVRIFFELPNETDHLMSCTFDKRIGAVNPEMLQIRGTGEGTEALHMRIHGVWTIVHGTAKREPVLLPNCVQDGQRDHRMTVQSIYDMMKAKRAGYFNVEVFERIAGQDDMGVLNWDAAYLGSVNPATGVLDLVDVAEKDWVYRLPVWRSMETAEVLARYPNQIQWRHETPHHQRFALAVCATRETATKDIASNHAFFELIIPERGQPGRFRLLPFGYQTPFLPADDIDRLLFLQKTQPCILHYPDESAVLSQRQRHAECMAISADEYAAIEDSFSHFVLKARQGRKYFQPTGSNCGRHAQKLFDDTVGQRFYAPFEALANVVMPGEEDRIQTQLKRITKALDDEALDELATDLVEALVEGHDYQNMAELLALCLATLAYTAKDGPEVEAFKITAEEALARVQTLYQQQSADEADAIMLADLKALIIATVSSQQFYKTSVYDVEVQNPYLGPIYNFIVSVQWEWLRSFLFRAFCFVLGSWRTYSYQKQDGTPKTVSVWNHALHGRAFNLPAQAFERPQQKQGFREEALQVLDHLPE